MSDAELIALTDTIDALLVAREFRGEGRNLSYVGAIEGMAAEIEQLRSEIELRRELARQAEKMRADAFTMAFPHGLPDQSR